EIPIELVNIKGLQLLHLFENKLTGVIPNEFTTLKNLTELDLSINHLNGTIPIGFRDLTKLTSLQLFNNSLSGRIPYALGANSPLWDQTNSPEMYPMELQPASLWCIFASSVTT
ncbi:LRR receptor-like kinase, partial [Trifolium medium]|nr:LRR receptor-like kinase [Trifolium medium]